jgi:hypothetical protein
VSLSVVDFLQIGVVADGLDAILQGDYFVTPGMRHHSGARPLNYFGFRGNRAAISLLYARSEGASQSEVNKAGRALGSPQENYLNMLHQAIK